MRLDADPGHSGIQPTRRIVGDQPFTIGIDVTKVGKVPYAGYQWSVQFANSELGFESYAENMSLTGLGLCVNPPNVSSDPQIVILYGGCITTDLNVPAQFVGGTTTIALHCLKSGQIQIALLTTLQGNGFGSSLLNKHGDELPTTLTGITIDCQVGGAEACADATGDGRVTRDDLRFIIGNMSRLHPDLRADVNGDGRVDRKDLSQATKQLGTRC